jgi:hypothetical protein
MFEIHEHGPVGVIALARQSVDFNYADERATLIGMSSLTKLTWLSLNSYHVYRGQRFGGSLEGPGGEPAIADIGKLEPDIVTACSRRRWEPAIVVSSSSLMAASLNQTVSRRAAAAGSR